MTSILINGSMLEGGGQIIRNSVSLSALLERPVSINKIRHARTPPGLRNQHRTGEYSVSSLDEYTYTTSGLLLAAEICSGHLTGATTGSSAIDFTPGQIHLPGNFKADSVTAGSTTLLLQIALPILLFSPTRVEPSVLTLLGGTNASQAPQIDHIQHVFLPFMRRHFGLDGVEIQILKRGYFPKGGGEVRVSVPPFYNEGGEGLDTRKRLKGIRLLERGRVKHVGGIAHFAGLPMSVGRSMVMGAKRKLGEPKGLNPEEDVGDVGMMIEYKRERNEDTRGAGSGIVLWAELEGGGIVSGSAIGRKGLDPVQIGEDAAEQLLQSLHAGGCVDEVTRSSIIVFASLIFIIWQWLQDQVIIFMALAEGKSELNCGTGGLSLHTRYIHHTLLQFVTHSSQDCHLGGSTTVGRQIYSGRNALRLHNYPLSGHWSYCSVFISVYA